MFLKFNSVFLFMTTEDSRSVASIVHDNRFAGEACNLLLCHVHMLDSSHRAVFIEENAGVSDIRVGLVVFHVI